MSRKIITTILFILSLSVPGYSQVQLGIGVPENVFVANATAAPQTGTVYAIPASGNVISWVVTYGSAPASVTVLLEFSNDNSTWATGDTSTAVAGETRTVFNASKFVRATESARSGGGAITLTVTAKTGPIANLNTVGTSGQILAGSGTALLPIYTFVSAPTTGFFLSGPTSVDYAATGGSGLRFSGGGLSTWGSGVYNWASGALGTSVDVGISRTASGNIGVGNGTAGDTSGSVNAGAYVSTSPAIGYIFSARGRLGTSADGIFIPQNNATTIGVSLKVDALPTVASGFGTSPSVTAGSTPFAGSINIGTGGVAVTGVINFNGTAFPSAPFCQLTNQLTNGVTRYVASTTQLTLNITTAWTASDVISWFCASSK